MHVKSTSYRRTRESVVYMLVHVLPHWCRKIHETCSISNDRISVEQICVIPRYVNSSGDQLLSNCYVNIYFSIFRIPTQRVFVVRVKLRMYYVQSFFSV